ncbi:MAG: response regulator [Flavobacteriales bacterium]|nr:response regulator [Flavobacteriales bacterium]
MELPYKQIIEGLGSSTMLFAINKEGNVIWCSGKFAQLVQHEPEQCLGLPVTSILGGDEFVEAFAKWKNGSTQGSLRVNVITSMGTSIPCVAYRVPLDTEDGICMMHIEVEQLDPENVREAELLKALYHNLREGLYRSTEDGRLVHTNQAFLDMLGYESFEDASHIHTSELYVQPDLRKELQRKLDEDGFIRNEEVLLKKKDGTVFWGWISATKSLDRNGHALYDGVMRDISARKEMEQQLRIQKARAEQAAQAKELFLSTMSHELRTPMNAVIGMTHLLLARNPKPEQITDLNTLKFSAENLLHIINDILDFSKIEAGKIELEETVFDLHQLMHQTLETLKFRADNKGIQLRLKLDPECPAKVRGDSTRLAQILNNLISNAIKFTYHGEVILAVRVLKLEDTDVRLHFSIQDTGIGIPKEKLNSIFDLFTQASSSTTRQFGGTGLGLTITKSLLELQGSQLQVESQPGFGSNFFFEINFHLSEGTGSDRKSPEEMEGKLIGYHVLITEDNEVNQILVRKFLNMWGATCDIARNGLEAIEMIQARQYDLVLMDLQMPVMDGYTASRKIRQIPGYSVDELPIIAVTASALIEVRKKALEAGMNDYVSKPFSPEQLFERMSKYFNAGQRTSS